MTVTKTAYTTPRPPWRIGVDVGGTFTDLVMADSTGATWVTKVLSVPEDPSRGVVAALERLAIDLGSEVREVLGNCHLFVHGSTVATNTMLEGKGATVGLLTTEGFRDALELRRGLREDQWNHRAPFAPVLVPRYRRLGVGGRIGKDGQELAPLSATDVEEALDVFSAEGVEAVAIALFNSFVNETHEIDAEEIVRRQWSGKWITRSAAVSPLMGEYERTSTAVINASLAPRIIDYLRNLEERLDTLGLSRPMLLIQSNGGAASLDRIAPRPVNLLLSGPSAAVGALDYFRRAIDSGVAGGDYDPENDGNLISMEIGGTSCDVMLMSNGRVADKDELMIAGYHVSTPVIDIHTIGAGGGTIARVDSAGMLLVGPEGAGADPGPACYGLGGSEATVTDATPAAVLTSILRLPARQFAFVWPNHSGSRSKLVQRVSFLCWSRICFTQFSTSQSNEAMRPIVLLLLQPAGRDRCTAPWSPGGSVASGSMCHAMPVPCAPLACCMLICARTSPASCGVRLTT